MNSKFLGNNDPMGHQLDQSSYHANASRKIKAWLGLGALGAMALFVGYEKLYPHPILPPDQTLLSSQPGTVCAPVETDPHAQQIVYIRRSQLSTNPGSEMVATALSESSLIHGAAYCMAHYARDSNESLFERIEEQINFRRDGNTDNLAYPFIENPHIDTVGYRAPANFVTSGNNS
jgi:hypothetical protein